MRRERTLPWDWFPGSIPENAVVDESAYIETSYSFQLFRSRKAAGVKLGRGASTYLGTMFDVGPKGQVHVGDYSLIHGARIICDTEITIGDYALISWNVVLMDTYRIPLDPIQRRAELELLPSRQDRWARASVESKPVHIAANVWIGFDSCVLPGVTIGTGSIIGARSVVTQSVPPFTIAAGNPARVVREISAEERNT